MSRPLEVVAGLPAPELSARLREALSNDGPALLPRESRARSSSAPSFFATGSSASTDSSSGGPNGAPLGDAGAGALVPLPREVRRSVALVIETSGSTGVPKRVALSTDALLASAAASEQALGGPGQWLLALPTHYVAGLQVLVRSIAAGTQPVVHPPGHFSPQAFAALAGRLEQPLRFSSLVPAQLARLVEAAEADRDIRRAVARFDALLIGGQALPDPLRERALDLGFAVVRTYGASETAGGCVYDGRPIGRTVVRLVAGEIEIAGPSLAEGYLGDDALTAARFHTDEGLRWYRTTDTGTVVDGVVTVTGRLDDLIISGGIKVSLGRVERLVQAQRGFEQAVVVPRDSERWGQVGVVVVDDLPAAPTPPSHDRAPTGRPIGSAETGDPVAGGLQAGDPTSDQPVIELGGARLDRLRETVVREAGRAAAPAALVHVHTLPRLASGKPDRVLIERLVAAGAPGIPATGAPGVPAAGAPGIPAAGAPGVPAAGAPGAPAAGAPGSTAHPTTTVPAPDPLPGDAASRG
ncbi:AMP-binding protein [Herbiconiux sp. CPCC 205716]|uniref:AMP-binding protein n=1 Tax=Herbiconiux gentiana TaxID=2970912 RepID=A0ABT2GHC9_9MICO|nr:AMP-binding protein [Herbiconiux gentiana]MCS5715583.1 AMP-binding protein [Herbiconiux gentiana]